MLGRGIDQIQPTPSDPILYEDYIQDARCYVRLAERANGPVSRAVPPEYVWGAARELLADPARRRILNLETAITTSDTPWPEKGIHYRMHPANIACLTAIAPDCLVLANNHVIDWCRDGLLKTLDTLETAGIATTGAGRDRQAATAPAILSRPDGGRLLVFAAGHSGSGIPVDWAARTQRPGVNYLPDLSAEQLNRLADMIDAIRQPGDQVVLSIHWGGNWGYDIAEEQQAFAHGLIDRGSVDLIHGHSSHHPKAMEVYRDRLILYGCGDLLNDYEGIGGHETYRGDLALLYLPTLQAGRLTALHMLPFQIRNLRLNRPSANDIDWLTKRINREAARFGGNVHQTAGGPTGVGLDVAPSR